MSNHYTTESEVQQLFNNLNISSTTVVKTATIAQLIIDADTIINARLRRYYAIIPVTDDDDKKYLSVISKNLVAAQISEMLIPSVSDDEGKRYSPQRAYAMGLLNDIAPKKNIGDMNKIPVKLNTAKLSTSVFSGSQGIPDFNLEDTY